MSSTQENPPTPDSGTRVVGDTAAHRRYTNKQKLIAGISGAALLLFIGGGIVVATASQNQPIAEAPAEPSEAPVEPEAPNNGETVTDNTNLVSPEEILKMNPGELQEFVTITAWRVALDGSASPGTW